MVATHDLRRQYRNPPLRFLAHANSMDRCSIGRRLVGCSIGHELVDKVGMGRSLVDCCPIDQDLVDKVGMGRSLLDCCKLVGPDLKN